MKENPVKTVLEEPLAVDTYAIVRQVANGYVVQYYGPEGHRQYVAKSKNDARAIIFNQIFL